MRNPVEPAAVAVLATFAALLSGAVLLARFSGLESERTVMAALDDALARSKPASPSLASSRRVWEDGILAEYAPARPAKSPRVYLVAIPTAYGPILGAVQLDASGKPQKAVRFSSSGARDLDGATDLALADALGGTGPGAGHGTDSAVAALVKPSVARVITAATAFALAPGGAR